MPRAIRKDGFTGQFGGGEKISGDPHQFLLVATGRADPSPLGLDESVNIFA